MAKKNDEVVSAGVLVVCRPCKYWRDSVTNKTHVGEMGSGKKARPASPPFRISRARWLRDESLGASDRLFQRVDEPQDTTGHEAE